MVLVILMISSFAVSEYEYNKVQEKYQIAFNEANATLFNQTNNSTQNETFGKMEAPEVPEKHKKHKKHHKVIKDEDILNEEPMPKIEL